MFDCLTARGDELFDLADALLCADGPVTSPVDLTLMAEHRRRDRVREQIHLHGLRLIGAPWSEHMIRRGPPRRPVNAQVDVQVRGTFRNIPHAADLTVT